MKNGKAGSAMALVAVTVLLALAPAWGQEQSPRFADHPGAARFTGRNAVPVLASAEARRFRTMIRDGARRKPNFDGHYIVTTWGCGTDCEMGAIIDAISGGVVSLPVVAGSLQDATAGSTHFDYRLDSNLLVMNGMIGEEPPMGTHYFTFDGSRLALLKTIPKPEKHWDTPGPGTPR
ncbi:MAG TPA: hypothetical protein VJ770_20070 [Stellaceae bacterium]|nr:hypothetical protein [Stellaceae bacterium]